MGALQRMDSDDTMRMINKERGFCGVCKVITHRNWSGNLGQPQTSKVRSAYKKLDKKRSVTFNERMVSNEGIDYEEETGIEHPRLMRSGGLRRDWSFENLLETLRNGKRDDPNVTQL